MDGQLDASADEVAANGSRHLYAALHGDVLYVATEDAGEGNDVFIYLADAPGALRAANWAKAGQIADGTPSWPTRTTTTTKAGSTPPARPRPPPAPTAACSKAPSTWPRNLARCPTQIYVAVGVYQSADGGALVASQQVPASVNGNGNIDAVEYFLLQFVATPGDFNRDGDVDDADYNLWRSDVRLDRRPARRRQRRHVVDAADYIVWRRQLGTNGERGRRLHPLARRIRLLRPPSPSRPPSPCCGSRSRFSPTSAIAMNRCPPPVVSLPRGQSQCQ